MRKVARPFGILFPIVLTVTLTLLVIVGIDRSMPDREVYLQIAVVVLASALVSALLVILYQGLMSALPKVGKGILAWITIQTVKKAIIDYKVPVPASGIASVEGSLVIGLDVGSATGINLGDQFIVYNTISRESVGILEVARLQADLSVCRIIGMTNPEF